jgi:tRNA (adenine57-N1/adenine58-N1)-methyltransferase
MNPASASSSAPPGALEAGEPVILVDRKLRKYLTVLNPQLRFDLRGGVFSGGELIGKEPGALVHSTRGEPVRVYRPTLEEYTLMMPRGATVIPPKDAGVIVQWGDIFPGAVVAEAGIGSGAMTLFLLRAVGAGGRVFAFDLRQDFINLARKNIAAWPERAAGPLDERLEVHLGDVAEGLRRLSGIDRVVLDLPQPWDAVDAAAAALKPGGILIAYNPGIRQIDRLAQAILDHREFREPEVSETIQRPWAVDRLRLRPELRIVGHTGFLLRARRRSPSEREGPAFEAAAENGDASPEDSAPDDRLPAD